MSSQPLPPNAAEQCVAAFKPLADAAMAIAAENTRRRLDDLRLVRDGNAWMVAASDFVNLQDSVAGFGLTPNEAHQDYLANIRLATKPQDGLVADLFAAAAGFFISDADHKLNQAEQERLERLQNAVDALKLAGVELGTSHPNRPANCSRRERRSSIGANARKEAKT